MIHVTNKRITRNSRVLGLVLPLLVLLLPLTSSAEATIPGDLKSVQDPELQKALNQLVNAQGWGGMPVELGVSNIYRNTRQFAGDVCQTVTFEEPDNKYFTSITLYDETGYMIDSSRFSINSYEWDKNTDGTVTISFNCGDSLPISECLRPRFPPCWP